MKSRLLSTVAVIGGVVGLSDAAAAQVPPAFQWTGCYIGAQAGGGWGDTENQTLNLTADTSGWLAGGQIGCDYQFAPHFLLGVEGMAAWTDINGAADPFFSGKNVFRFSTQTDWIASATARAGVTADRWLIFVKGGPAWVNSDFRVSGSVFPIGSIDGRGSETGRGWTFGIGVEWAFAPQWSAKLEFNHYEVDFGSVRLRDRFSGTSMPNSFEQDLQTLTFAINYRFATGRP
jgi:outer membrane immunogenic protein